MKLKDERVHLRVTRDDKIFLQSLADRKCKGNLTALFDSIIKDLKDDYDFNRGELDE